jgi:hypothetical protein
MDKLKLSNPKISILKFLFSFNSMGNASFFEIEKSKFFFPNLKGLILFGILSFLF